MKMQHLNVIVSLFSMSVVFLDARLIARGDEVPPKDPTDMYNCYVRYVSEPLDKGVAFFYDNTVTNVTKYIQSIQSARDINNLRAEFFVGDYAYSPTLVIIVTTEIEILEAWFKSLAYSPNSNVRTRYLIVYLGKEPTDKIFELAWLWYIVNIAVLRQDNTSVYTYFPYGNGECGELIRSEVLGQCQQLSLAALYPTKVPKVFHGCKLRITTVISAPAVIEPRANTGDPMIDGYESVMVNSIVERLNLSKQLNVSDVHERVEADGTISTWIPILNLYLNISDMYFATAAHTSTFIYPFETSYVYHIDTMVWLAPLAGPGAQWMSVILVFQGSMWYAVLGFFLLNTFVWWIFGRRTNYWHGSYLEILLGSLLVLLNGTVPFPKRTVMRFLVTSWTVCSLLVIAAYQCQFLSILLKPVYEKQIINEREIVESGVPVILWSGQELRLEKSNDQCSKTILRRAQILSLSEYKKYKFRVKKHSVFMQSLIVSKYGGMFSLNDPNDRSTVYVFKEPIFIVPVCMYFRRGHPMLERWNEMLMQFVESGLFGKLISNMGNTPPDIPEEPEKVPINMRHLSSAFYILLFGYAAALLAFLFEQIVHRIKKKPQTRCGLHCHQLPE